MRAGLAALLLALAAAAPAAATTSGDARVVFPASASQGAMVVGKVPPGSTVRHDGRTLRVTPYGSVVFGVGRDASGTLRVDVLRPDGTREAVAIPVTPRDWPVEQVTGVPPRTVEPPPEVAARIAREAALVNAARTRDDDRADFAQAFAWPVAGRISGRFGNQRVYNGKPGSPHSGMDIAVAAGTPVKAPAAGIVSLAEPDLYFSGGTLLLDHGHGISSNFLHLSRLDVKVGDRVEQGQVIGRVGATGRATGPHLHWGMNWFGVRIDPLLVLERAQLARRSDAVPLEGPAVVVYLADDDPAGEADLRGALDGVRDCLARSGITATTRLVRGDRLVLQEGGEELELVMTGPVDAYLFWPGRKPGEAVAGLQDAGPALRASAARYFGATACSRPG